MQWRFKSGYEKTWTVFFPLNVNTTLKDCFDEPNHV